MKRFLKCVCSCTWLSFEWLASGQVIQNNTAWFSTVRLQPPPCGKLEVGNTPASAVSAWDSLTALPPRLSFPRVAPSGLSGHTSMPPPYRGLPLARYLEKLLSGLSELPRPSRRAPVATCNALLYLPVTCNTSRRACSVPSNEYPARRRQGEDFISTKGTSFEFPPLGSRLVAPLPSPHTTGAPGLGLTSVPSLGPHECASASCLHLDPNPPKEGTIFF